jgi:glycosyltransferase involved in cell wall biosynthesis
LPAITSVFAGVSSLLRDGVDSFILRDPHDAKTLATMIRTLYQKAEWRSRMGQAAAKASLEWTWDRNTAEVWELLRNAAFKKRQLPTKKT